jgi:hypothetical protein
LFEVDGKEVFFVRGTGVFVADLGYGHEFGLIVAVHEVDEALFFDEPLGEVVVFGLCEVHGLGVGVAMGRIFEGVTVLDRERLQLGLVVASLYLVVDDIQKAEGLFHCNKFNWHGRMINRKGNIGITLNCKTTIR